MAALNANSVTYTVQGRGGSKESSGTRTNYIKMVFGDGASTYPAGGIPLTNLSKWGFPNKVSEVIIEDLVNADGYLYKWDAVNNKIRVYQSASIVSPSSLDLANPAFSGTGLTAVGQVITTTSTHTMTLNQCAGMWLLSATGSAAPMLILSNTAVTGAAAVLTVKGTAATDAGAYTIVKSPTVAASVLSEVSTAFVPALNVTMYAQVRGQ